MSDNVSDRLLIDVRGMDIEILLSDESMRTALDRVLSSSNACYDSGFNSSID